MWLVKFNRDWADEFSAVGFNVIDDETKSKWDNLSEKYPDKIITYFFGTNEGWEEEPIKEFLSSYRFIYLENIEADLLKNMFGLGFYGYGQFPNLIDIIESDEDEDE